MQVFDRIRSGANEHDDAIVVGVAGGTGSGVWLRTRPLAHTHTRHTHSLSHVLHDCADTHCLLMLLGKTTLARAILDSLDCDVAYISHDNYYKARVCVFV